MPVTVTDPTAGAILMSKYGAIPTKVNVPTLGVIMRPLTTLGAAPTNDKVPTLGVTIFPLTTTLGADPVSKIVPVGTVILPLTTSGAIPVIFTDPTEGTIPLSK
jgi:hypothetical protein